MGVSKIIQFPNREEETPHLTGEAKCLGCKHEWQAVAPVGTDQLECPKCQTMQGIFMYPISPREDIEVWVCDCGCPLYWIVADGFLCYRCGVVHTEVSF